MDEPAAKITSLLVLGGARSGKSGFAQGQAESSGLRPVFVATAQAFDREMSARIVRHAEARDARWRLVEVPYDLPQVLEREAQRTTILLVDCLTLWLSNLVLREDDLDVALERLLAAVADARGPLIFVSNEVGAGIVPDHPLGRRFRDLQGRVNQAMAAACDSVVLVTAGLPRLLKPQPVPSFRFAAYD